MLSPFPPALSPKITVIPKQSRGVEQPKPFLACTAKQPCSGSGVPPVLLPWGFVCVGLAAPAPARGTVGAGGCWQGQDPTPIL